MSEAPYPRIDLSRMDRTGQAPDAAHPDGDAAAPQAGRFRWWVVLFSIVLSVVQAFITLRAAHTGGPSAGLFPTSTLITVIGFAFLFIAILALNPLLKLLARVVGSWLKPLSRVELMAMIASLTVTAGVSTFGLTDQLIPLIPAPYNPEPGWNVPQTGWADQLHPYMRDELYITDPEAIREFREGYVADQPPADAPTLEWLNYYHDVFWRLPWNLWIGPLTAWMIFVAACYLMFFSLTYLVLDYWANREKLIFPLAKLPEAMLPDSDDQWVPSILKAKGFWVGFWLSFGVLAYNAMVVGGLLPGMGVIPLGMSVWQVQAAVSGTFFAGFSGGPEALQFLVIFTAIGIAFLLPLEISFSIWFYFLLSRTLIFIMVRMGYGTNYQSFPTDWLWTQNAVTAQGSGAILLFSAIGLWRSGREYVVLVRKSTGSLWTRLKIGLPVVGLAISFVIMTAWITWNNVPWYWSIALVAFLTLVTLGIMRIVAEGGIYWIQSHASFFHVYRMLGLGHFLPPVVIGPLLPIYSVLFLDIKTFLAPNLLNAAKMQQDVGGSRLKFHLTIVVSLVTSVIFSLGYAIVLGYALGAQQMNSWFYSQGPRGTVDTASQATSMPPQFQVATFTWFIIGMAWVGFTMYVRRTIFWFPHPIGYVMLINPLTTHLWFSFFIGWLFKKMVVKYGGKTTFDKFRLAFIGLIMGELIGVFLFTSLSLIYGIRLPATLNRYSN